MRADRPPHARAGRLRGAPACDSAGLGQVVAGEGPVDPGLVAGAIRGWWGTGEWSGARPLGPFAAAPSTSLATLVPVTSTPAPESASGRADGTSEPGIGVLWDLDGVVIDSEELYYRSYSRVLAEFGVSVSRPLYGREWVGAGHGAEWAVERFGLPIDAAEVKRRQRPVYDEMLRKNVALMPGVVAALDRLGAKFPMCVATNSRDEPVEFALGRFGLRERFKDVVSRSRYERSKPAPDAFLAGAAALGLKPARCVVIEDASKGVRAAHAACCPVIAVPNTFTRENDFSLASRVVDSLDDVTPELVRELASA